MSRRLKKTTQKQDGQSPGGDNNRARPEYKNKKFWEELIAYFPWYDKGHIENDASSNSYIPTINIYTFRCDIFIVDKKTLLVLAYIRPSSEFFFCTWDSHTASVV
jgi:hypothetical protein